MMPINEENPTPRIFNLAGLKTVHYGELFKALLKMFPEKWDAYEAERLATAYKKQNPTGDKSEAQSIPREFKEITGQKDFDVICKSHKACAIAFLPAVTTIDYELESFNQKVAMLAEVDKQAGSNMSPIHFTWVNTTCHVSSVSSSGSQLFVFLQAEVFSYFDVDPTSLPTVVFMHVNHNKYAQMIGKFDKESI